MKKQYLYLPLLTGILTPSAVIFFLQVLFAKMSPFKSVLDILRRQFASGHNLFLLMIWSFIPFGALILLTYVMGRKADSRRLAFIFWGGFIAVFAFALFGHISVWYPLYAHKGASSTDVLAYLIIPVLGLFVLPVGSFVGWIVSLLSRVMTMQ